MNLTIKLYIYAEEVTEKIYVAPFLVDTWIHCSSQGSNLEQSSGMLE